MAQGIARRLLFRHRVDRGWIVFVGRNTGELQALDAKTGKVLWSFQTGAAVNTTPTAFEDEGEEKVAVYAGGKQPGCGTEHAGAGEGELEKEKAKRKPANPRQRVAPRTRPRARACSKKTAPPAMVPPDTVATAAPIFGRCRKPKEQKGAEELVTDGGGGMPPFEGQLSPEEIKTSPLTSSKTSSAANDLGIRLPPEASAAEG